MGKERKVGSLFIDKKGTCTTVFKSELGCLGCFYLKNGGCTAGKEKGECYWVNREDMESIIFVREKIMENKIMKKELVKSYEDALTLLGKSAPSYLNEMPANEQAYHKLCIICEALNVGHEKKDRIYYPWWWKEDLKAGVAARYSYIVFARAPAFSGFRLCCFDRVTALYFGSKPFVKLWQDYLL